MRRSRKSGAKFGCFLSLTSPMLLSSDSPGMSPFSVRISLSTFLIAAAAAADPASRCCSDFSEVEDDDDEDVLLLLLSFGGDGDIFELAASSSSSSSALLLSWIIFSFLKIPFVPSFPSKGLFVTEERAELEEEGGVEVVGRGRHTWRRRGRGMRWALLHTREEEEEQKSA